MRRLRPRIPNLAEFKDGHKTRRERKNEHDLSSKHPHLAHAKIDSGRYRNHCPVKDVLANREARLEPPFLFVHASRIPRRALRTPPGWMRRKTEASGKAPLMEINHLRDGFPLFSAPTFASSSPLARPARAGIGRGSCKLLVGDRHASRSHSCGHFSLANPLFPPAISVGRGMESRAGKGARAPYRRCQNECQTPANGPLTRPPAPPLPRLLTISGTRPSKTNSLAYDSGVSSASPFSRRYSRAFRPLSPTSNQELATARCACAAPLSRQLDPVQSTA